MTQVITDLGGGCEALSEGSVLRVANSQAVLRDSRVGRVVGAFSLKVS